MADSMDFFNQYVMGSVQILTGAYFFARFLQKKMKPYFYFLFALVWFSAVTVIPDGRIMEFLVYILLLLASGMFVCHTDGKSVILYAALLWDCQFVILYVVSADAFV